MNDAGKYSNADCPQTSLEVSVRAIRQIADQCGETMEVASKELGQIWGLASTGGHRSKVRKSLVQYGLLENVRRGLYGVTELAVMILNPPSNEAYRTALIKALTYSEVYRYLWDSFGAPKQVSEREVRSKLEQRGRFADEKEVIQAAKLFRQSVQFVTGDGGIHNEGSGTAFGSDSMTARLELMERITVRQDVFGGKPIIRDLRIAVEHVLGMLAAGDTAETILHEYPFLQTEDIQACLLYAHRSIAGEDVHDRVPVSGS